MKVHKAVTYSSLAIILLTSHRNGFSALPVPEFKHRVEADAHFLHPCAGTCRPSVYKTPIGFEGIPKYPGDGGGPFHRCDVCRLDGFCYPVHIPCGPGSFVSPRQSEEKTMGMKPTQIHVIFVDAETGKTLGENFSPSDQMPKIFEPQKTTLNLAGTLWVLVKAEPSTADEYIRRGEVTISLEKVKHLPAQSILYSLPTICDTVPKVRPVNKDRTDALPVIAPPSGPSIPGQARTIEPKPSPIDRDIYKNPRGLLASDRVRIRCSSTGHRLRDE